jgi:capsular polysaccharide transport system permease protein
MSEVSRQLRLPRFVRVQFAMIMREMATSYGKSSFGYLWAILDPIGAIAILSIAFSLAFGAPALGESFPLFYATGYMPFVVYNTMQQQINGSIRENKQLLFYPRVTYLDAILSRVVLTLVTQLLVAVIVFGGVMVVYDIDYNINLSYIFAALLAACMLGLGIGSLNSVIVHLFPGWRNMWGIITRPLFLISCIFYLFDSLPQWAQAVLWFNPLVHIIGLTRAGFYASYEGDYVTGAYPFLIGGITLLMGLILLRRNAPYMINA